MATIIRKKQSHSYFVVMIDHGKRGLEAVVDPEITRRSVVDRIKSGEYSDIAFIHEIRDFLVEDVTAELIDEAEAALKADAFDRRAAIFDHAHDLRKNWEPV